MGLSFLNTYIFLMFISNFSMRKKFWNGDPNFYFGSWIADPIFMDRGSWIADPKNLDRPFYDRMIKRHNLFICFIIFQKVKFKSRAINNAITAETQ